MVLGHAISYVLDLPTPSVAPASVAFQPGEQIQPLSIGVTFLEH